MSHVDVVVPCYNYGRYLEACVRSILDQPGVEVRVLVIDDCSSDDSAAVARRLSEQDRRVCFVRHEINRGHISTYNEGLLGWVRAEYCLLISADDLLAPGSLARATGVLDARPDVAFCCGAQIVFTDCVPLSIAAASDDVRIYSGRDFWVASCDAGQNLVATPTAVVRSDLQRQVGPYRAELPHSGDLEMWLRLATHAGVAVLSSVQAFKRAHGSNMQIPYVTVPLRDIEERWKAFQSAFVTCRAVFDVDGLRASVRRALAHESLWSASDALARCDVTTFNCGRSLARELDPSIAMSLAWWRLAARRLMGERMVEMLVHLRRYRRYL